MVAIGAPCCAKRAHGYELGRYITTLSPKTSPGAPFTVYFALIVMLTREISNERDSCLNQVQYWSLIRECPLTALCDS